MNMRQPFDCIDAAALAACRQAAEAAAAYDAAANAEARDCGAEPLDLCDRERQAFHHVVATPAITPDGLAAKAALLVRWQDHVESAALAFSIAKDAIAIGEAIAISK
jgi:hypothetical protein